MDKLTMDRPSVYDFFEYAETHGAVAPFWLFYARSLEEYCDRLEEYCNELEKEKTRKTGGNKDG